MTDGVQVQCVLIYFTKAWKTKKNRARENESQAVRNLNCVGNEAVAQN